MSDVLHYEVRNGIAVLTIDNPPVNALGASVRDAILEGVRRAGSDPAAVAVVLIGKGTTFAAGADIREFGAISTREASLERSEGVHRLLTAIEDSPKPVVAAIRGPAFGGGLEFAMACHYRVAGPDARLGQPEVSLGIIPGAGGTQRLPRLVGPALAIRMCADGKPISAADAMAAGLVDRVVPDDLLEGAMAFAQDKAARGERRKTRDITFDAATVAAGRAAASDALGTRSGHKGSPAPLKAIQAIEAAFAMPFDIGSARERELFADCVVSTESRALRHLFFAEREAARPPGIDLAAPIATIRSAAVVGAGTMGIGIAMCYASAGIPVVLKEVSDDAVDRGLAAIRRTYESAVAKGRMSAAQYEQAMNLIAPTTAYDRFANVDVVVEAVFEDLALKRTVFSTLAGVTRPDCILASNTSTLDIDALAEACGRPAQVVGHHFFSPANVMKLLEVVRGRATSDAVIASSLALGRRLGKVCAVVGNCFGFVANRMLAYYMRESYLLLEEGAAVEQIDRVIVDFGLPVGPFAMQDIAGIDVGARIRQHLAKEGKTRAEGPQSEVPDRLFEMGRYGQKTAAGWYRYEPGSRTPIPDPQVNEIAAAAAARRGIDRRAHIPDEEILERITTALANEGARVLDEGYASRAGDIDVIYCNGFGFPRYRGGPMFYADTIGLPIVLGRVRAYRERFGDYWRPAPLLERLVAEGRGFY